MTDETRQENANPETENRGNGETVSTGATANGTRDAEPGTLNLEPASGDAPEATPHPYEALLDEYPLREPSEDPVWSVRIIKGWMYFLAFNFAWMLLFFILGIFYE